MKPFLDSLVTYWCPAALLTIALAVLAALGLLRHRHIRGFTPFLIISIALVIASIGGFVLPPRWGGWLLVSAIAVFISLFLLLAVSGAWWRWPAYVLAILALFGAGGLWLNAIGAGILEIAHDLRGLTFLHPWWLLLLLLVPLFFVLSAPRLNRSEPRPWIAVCLRSAGVICLSLALAEPQLRQPNDHVTVLFVVDRSKSIPEELVDDASGKKVDQRERRIRQFLNHAVEKRGAGHERDRAGLIIFGRKPRLELPPSDAPRFNLTGELPAPVDGDHTGIAAALKLALASFADDTGKRIVLISDGNENLGNAEEQARLAKTLGVEIDVLPLAAGQTNEDEVLVERVEAPPIIEQGARVPIRVLIRSHNPNRVIGRVILRQIIEGQKVPAMQTKVVALRRGLNVVTFTRKLTDEQRSYSYEAEFLPERVEDDKGEVVKRELPGDRVQNNRAATHVIARGQRRILILEGKAGEHRFLVEKLGEAGRVKFKIVAEPIALLDQYKDRDKLAVFLSNFDCVVLANVAADQVSEEQQEVIRSNTHDQGCGLVMIGGPDSYGAGGWQNTPVEKALPVDSEIKSLQVLGKGGLVLIMHASEMADGNMWQKKIAKLAVERLGPGDEVGVIYYDFIHKWHIKLQPIGGNKASILAQIDKMTPGDMPDFDPALQMAHQALIDPKKGLATKHVIVISDGDPQYTQPILKAMKRDKVTVTTVGVACHGANEDQKMAVIAKATGGRSYSVKDPRQLPAIYIKESRLVSQSFIHEKPFTPIVRFRSGPTDGLPQQVPDLRGFVRTTPKGSPLVEIAMQTPRFADQEFPLLAYWHYGLGKVVAFTSDAGDPKFWSRAWTQAGGGQAAMYAKFWEQIIDWSLRPTESRRLNMITEYRDGKIRILVDARTDDGRPDIHLKLRGGITPPRGKGGEPGRERELRFVQTNSGQYEAEVKAEEAGSYFLNAQAVRMKKVKGRDGKEHEIEEGVDSVRAGVTLPYSPEFAELSSNTPLLERLRELTGGQRYEEDDILLDETAKAGAVFRPAPERVKSLLPLWYWLVFLSAVLLLSDVAVRRLAIDPERIAERGRYVWARLRGLPVPEPRQEIAERLRMRRTPGGMGPAQARAVQRFESETTPTSGLPSGADATVAPPPPSPPGVTPAAPSLGAAPPEPEAGDYASRLLKAKKKALEERKKDEPK
ncbi:MAG TPA: VWA domain-containing protein [Gemmataceae bacterium]|nr:VWA domain-containing protein [Gemmataceae bacterium]